MKKEQKVNTSNDFDRNSNNNSKTSKVKKGKKKKPWDKLSKGTFSSQQKSNVMLMNKKNEVTSTPSKLEEDIAEIQASLLKKSNSASKIGRKKNPINKPRGDPWESQVDNDDEAESARKPGRKIRNHFGSLSQHKTPLKSYSKLFSADKKEEQLAKRKNTYTAKPGEGRSSQQADKEEEEEQVIEELSSQLNEQASQLSDRMKQISVYDLCQLTNQQENMLINALVKQRLTSPVSQPQKPSQQSPGVAPQVINQLSEPTQNISIEIGQIIEQMNQLNEGRNMLDDNRLSKHLKSKNSIIPESNEEYMLSHSHRYNSNRKEEDRDEADNPYELMQKDLVSKISTNQSPKKATKGYNPMEEYVNQSNFSSRNNPISKSQAVSKETKSSKKVKTDQRGKKYFKDLNKRYTYNNSPSRTNANRDTGSKNKPMRPSTVNEKVNVLAGQQETEPSEILRDSERKRREPIKHTFNEYKSQVSQLQTIDKITPPSNIQLRSPQHSAQQDKTTYFQRKNSSPQPIRIKGL